MRGYMRVLACTHAHARTQNMLSNEVDAAAITNIIEAHRTIDKQMHAHAHTNTLLRQHSVNEDRSQSCRYLVLQVQGHQSLSEH